LQPEDGITKAEARSSCVPLNNYIFHNKFVLGL